MKPPLPSRITIGNFKKAVAGSKGFVSSKQYGALKKVGLGSLEYKGNTKLIGKDQATKALKALKESSQLGSKPGYAVWTKAANLERDQIMRKDRLKQSNLQTLLAMDVADQMTYERMTSDIYTKRTFSSLNEKIEYEKKMREKKVAEGDKKRSGLLNAGIKPKSPDFPSFPAGNIG